MHRSLSALAALCAVAVLPSCSDELPAVAEPDIVATDPLLARALTDPLMVDPDLAYRNEANAAVTIRYDHPLPPLTATDELAESASNLARVKLLEDGPIPELPLPVSDTVPNLSNITGARALVEQVGGPADCASRLEDDIGWAAQMPGPSAIMPHGMTQQAAGVESAACSMRVVRYLTPAAMDSVMQFHLALSDRARLGPVVYDSPERAIVGKGREEALVVHVRPGSGGLTAVDLIYWKK
ncbi:hypothetical protein [Erythrobacter sp. THAF29]|uniref:hypothetical protein n=1 Tax=Erythrobacter sp. THAF29 TaxID=2587851 RepID=UPI0012683A8B|nr:hypothetical protein [Erythrobacter sp. THAF29]